MNMPQWLGKGSWALSIVWCQYISSQNMTFWLKHYFELKAVWKKVQEKCLCLLTICLKSGQKFKKVCPCPLYQEGQKTTLDLHQPGDRTKAIHLINFTNEPFSIISFHVFSLQFATQET